MAFIPLNSIGNALACLSGRATSRGKAPVVALDRHSSRTVRACRNLRQWRGDVRRWLSRANGFGCGAPIECQWLLGSGGQGKALKIEKCKLKNANCNFGELIATEPIVSFLSSFSPLRSEEHTSELQSRGHLV